MAAKTFTKKNFPIPAFNFDVMIEGVSFEFSEVSGLKATSEFHPVRSGGSNNYHFKIPTTVTYGEITMKRGFVHSTGKDATSSKKLAEKLEEKISLFSPYSFAKKQFEDIYITLRDEAKTEICFWALTNPCLLSWEMSPFNAQNNELAFETLVFTCAEIVPVHY